MFIVVLNENGGYTKKKENLIVMTDRMKNSSANGGAWLESMATMMSDDGGVPSCTLML